MASSRRPPTFEWGETTFVGTVLAGGDVHRFAAEETGWLFREIKTMYGQVLTEPLPPEMTHLLMILSEHQRG